MPSTIAAAAAAGLPKISRAAIEARIETLIALLDELDGDPDLEPDADGEPSLGWPERMAAAGWHGAPGADDRELEDEHDEAGGDDEPALGRLEACAHFGDRDAAEGYGDGDDRERDDDDEPSLAHGLDGSAVPGLDELLDSRLVFDWTGIDMANQLLARLAAAR